MVNYFYLFSNLSTFCPLTYTSAATIIPCSLATKFTSRGVFSTTKEYDDFGINLNTAPDGSFAINELSINSIVIFSFSFISYSPTNLSMLVTY